MRYNALMDALFNLKNDEGEVPPTSRAKLILALSEPERQEGLNAKNFRSTVAGIMSQTPPEARLAGRVAAEYYGLHSEYRGNELRSLTYQPPNTSIKKIVIDHLNPVSRILDDRDVLVDPLLGTDELDPPPVEAEILEFRLFLNSNHHSRRRQGKTTFAPDSEDFAWTCPWRLLLAPMLAWLATAHDLLGKRSIRSETIQLANPAHIINAVRHSPRGYEGFTSVNEGHQDFLAGYVRSIVPANGSIA